MAIPFDVLLYILTFVRRDKYIIYATISKDWRRAWDMKKYSHITATPRQIEKVLYGYFLEAGCPENILFSATNNNYIDAAYYGYMPSIVSLPYDLVHFDANIFMAAVRGKSYNVLLWMAEVPLLVENVCAYSIMYFHNEVLEWALDRKFYAAGICKMAAKVGNLEGLQIAHKFGHRLSADVAEIAFEANHNELLLWALEHGCSLFTSAIKVPNIEGMDIIHKFGYKFNSNIYMIAANTNNNQLIRWALDNHCPYDEIVCNNLAGAGNLEAIRMIHAAGHKLSPYTCEIAISVGKIEILEYVLQSDYKCDDRLCTVAARHGNLDAMIMLRHYGFSFDEKTMDAAIVYKKNSILSWLISHDCGVALNACNRAILHNNLEGLKLLMQSGHTFDNYAYMCIFSRGEILEWCLCNDLIDRKSVCDLVGIYGTLEEMKIVTKYGCVWSDTLCELLARKRKYDILVWGIDNGYPHNTPDICLHAATNGDMAALVKLREKGCPWKTNVLVAAAMEKNRKMVKWIISNRMYADSNPFIVPQNEWITGLINEYGYTNDYSMDYPDSIIKFFSFGRQK